MNYYKIIDDGYIVSIVKGDYANKGIKITENEYNDILSTLKNAPTPPADCICRLKYNLQWEHITVDETKETDKNIDIAERISKLEEQSKTNADEIINLQEALCEVYETII